MSLGHLYVLLGEVSIEILCPFFNWIVFLVLSCMSSLYILEIKSLSNVSLTNMFPYIQFYFYFDNDFGRLAEAFLV